jgi:hypothetical protein
MKSAIFFPCLLLFMQASHGQLYISMGAQLQMTGNAQLTLQNTSLVNHGNFAAGPGSVFFTGNNPSTISGSQTTVFNDIEINKSNGTVTLQQPINVLHQDRFTSGNLDLNGNILDLGTTGSLLGESENSRITGSNGGHVLFSTTLNNPNNLNAANLGAVITSTQNLGNVVIRRGHKSQLNNSGNGNSILRYYDIVPTNNTPFTATLRINYFDTELNGLTENNLVFWNSSDNFHWTNEGYSSSNININYFEKTGITRFGRWTLSTINNALPVKFTLFNLECKGTKITLNWKTAQEQNSSHYNVEKSMDAVNWAVIGDVPAAGNSSTERSYLFDDNNPVQKSYYRIAQYDLDRRVTYTNIIRSTCSQKDVFNVWPNPFTDRILIDLTADRQSTAMIKIFDSKGALVKKQEATVLNGINQLTVYPGTLPAGVYGLTVEWGNGQMRRSIMVVKQ